MIYMISYKFMKVSFVLNLHTVKIIVQAILKKKILELDFNSMDARGQTYDNDSSMSKKFEGV